MVAWMMMRVLMRTNGVSPPPSVDLTHSVVGVTSSDNYIVTYLLKSDSLEKSLKWLILVELLTGYPQTDN